MKKPTIEDRIYNHLMKHGQIDNFYCIDNRITTRLGAVIHKLKEKGKLSMLDEENCGYIPNTKNYVYRLKKPTRWEVFKVGEQVVSKVPHWD